MTYVGSLGSFSLEPGLQPGFIMGIKLDNGFGEPFEKYKVVHKCGVTVIVNYVY